MARPRSNGIRMVPIPDGGDGMMGPPNNRKGFRPMERQRESRGMDFEALIKRGENPRGMTAQTNNGTAHYEGTGWNRRAPYAAPEIEPGGAWPSGRFSNRTGE